MRFLDWRWVAGLLIGLTGAVPGSTETGTNPGAVMSGVLARDQFAWRFTRTTMAGAPRSVAIPLATNLHLAFDVNTLRTHTAWTGSKPVLAGYQFGQGSTSVATYSGTTLWTLPPICPWRIGSRSVPDSPVPPGESDFRGISSKGAAVTLLYDLDEGGGRLVRVCESARAEQVRSSGAIIRRFEMAPTRQPLWFLAHEESGSLLPSGAGDTALVLQRGNDVVAVALRGGAAKLEPEIVGTNIVRIWVHVEASSRAGVFEVVSLVCKSPAQAQEAVSGALASSVTPAWKSSSRGKDRGEETLSPPTYLAAALPARAGGDAFYRREQIPVPKEMDLLAGGMDWMPDGGLAISTWTGEVYLGRGISGAATNVTWRRFASGLHEPLGLKVVNGTIYVVQKCELTRLVDTDGNGEADFYECVNDDWGFNGNMHYFAYGPALDARGNFYVSLDGNTAEWNPQWDVPYRGWTVKISPDGHKLEGLSSGLRSPNGCFAFGPDADIFTTDNEGHWLGTCKLNHCRRGAFFGYPSSTPMPREVFQKPFGFDPPAVWFPRKLATSASGGVTVPKNFGAFEGQLLVGDFGTSSILRVALERVNGEWQGAVWPFAKGFLSGVNRLSFGPDGKLYVGGLKRGWSSSGPQDFALERMTFTGETPFEISGVRARKDGFDLTFTQPVDPVSVSDAQSWDASQFGYKFHAAYGSPEIDHAGRENSATPLAVTSAKVSEDRLRVQLRFADWKAGYVTAVRNPSVRSTNGTSLRNDTFYYTLNNIPK